jgi:hypothetical protein
VHGTADVNLPDPRDLTDAEIRLLEDVKHLALRDGFDRALVSPKRARLLEAPDYRLFEFELPGIIAAQPEEGVLDFQAHDTDGVEITLLFCVKGSYPWSIEFIRADGKPIQQLPPVDAFKPWKGENPPN